MINIYICVHSYIYNMHYVDYKTNNFKTILLFDNLYEIDSLNMNK